MQHSRLATVFALLALTASFGADAAQDRTITKVVKMLEEMLSISKEDGESERVIYAKYKCYCDTNKENKANRIDKLTKDIGLLESKIDEAKGSNGELSTECAQLKSDLAENEAAQDAAENIRKKEHEAFVALETDLTQAIGQMDDAIRTLADVGADQTLGAAADHTKFMAGKGSLLKLKATVKQALMAASVFLTPKQQQPVQSFLQAPFTGSYAAQSGAVVGILKNMRDTFKANLASSRATEKVQLEAHEKLMKTLIEANKEMTAAYERKQEKLGGNDSELASKKEQLATAKEEKAEAEDFLAKLEVMCAEKAKDYEARKLLRANEDAAIAEAVSILNSDAAFATFGGASATRDGATGLLQLRTARRHVLAVPSEDVRLKARRVLRSVVSPRLSKVAALLAAENPFTVVLDEIDKMIALIAKEGKADKENLDWCNSERTSNDEDLEEKKSQIEELNEEITTLDSTINDPETGLKVQIAGTEEALEENHNDQVTKTKDRQSENVAYQKDIKNLVDAEDLLQRAVKVLGKYYKGMRATVAGDDNVGATLVQDDPAPPGTWDDYSGQSSKGGDAISMLEFILEETKKEEAAAHKSETDSQHDYEDEMADAKEEEATLQKQLANLQQELADSEKTMLMKKELLKKTDAEKVAIETYLVKIKPGCDFITTNFETRNGHRASEKKALEEAVTLLKGTPAFQAAVTEADQEALGDCKDTCNDAGEAHATCKACLAKVTVPGYCAGHAGTEGC